MRSLEVGGGLVVLVGAGYAGHSWPGAGASVPDSDEVLHFVSRPDLTPPRVTLARPRPPHPATTPSARYIFVTPKGYQTTGPGQAGLMVLDREGKLLWFMPKLATSESPFDLQVQTYQGKPVLTWWQGTVVNGSGQGECYIADSSYRQIATVQAGNGLKADLHELVLTPQGTALITAYRTTTTDLSAIGGPSKGQVMACQAQEIDVATGKLVFSWDSLDHVPVTETEAGLTNKGPFDYFHINSVSLAPDGDLLISARNTWTVYKVSRSSGDIVWRLNGKHSDFTMGKGSHFYWQHHVRAHAGNQLSIFDDAASPPEEAQSRGILLHLDPRTMQASLVRQYVHPARLLAGNQGSMQVLSDNRVFIGWGNQPYFSEFLRDGTLVLDGRFPVDDQSYRAFAYDWVGTPTDDPAMAVKPDTTGGVTVFASWNGATQLDSWQVLAGKGPSSLAPAASAPKVGFETPISVDSSCPYFAVVALDTNSTQIGRSKPVRYG
ncbi:MAG: arylsulfotransferase family protein [Acidimicrobiales bacterium]